MRSFAVAFTGHRPPRLGGYGAGENSPIARNVRTALGHVVDRIIAAHPEGTIFMSGMAQGVDTWAAEIVIARRNSGPRGVQLTAVVPFTGHERVWPRAAQERHRAILMQADEVAIIQRCGPETPTPAQVRMWLRERNDYMVARADLVVAVFDGSPGGTAEAVSYARRVGVPIIRIDPATVRTMGAADLEQLAQQLIATQG
jgi:uncharacterized phage-like protein YoqJ